MADDDINLYYSYASNLLEERLRNSIRSPNKVGLAQLQGYTLMFNAYSEKWQGALAQAVEEPGKSLWGVLWEISKEEKQRLFVQEGVNMGVYQSKNVEVTSPEGVTYTCFLILRSDRPETNNLPSPAYKKVIVDGARECGLPADYIEWLDSFPDNGRQVDPVLTGSNF